MAKPTRGLLDTPVVIDHDVVDPASLPDESAVAPVTLAELAAGPRATGDDMERARRQDRLQWAAATWEPLPLDAEAARALRSRVRGHEGDRPVQPNAPGRSAHRRDRGRPRPAALHQEPRNFIGLDGIVQVVAV